MAKVELERNECIGCGACSAIFPEGWQMSDDGKVNLLNSTEVSEGMWEKDTQGEEQAKHQEAADSCPVSCIHMKE